MHKNYFCFETYDFIRLMIYEILIIWVVDLFSFVKLIKDYNFNKVCLVRVSSFLVTNIMRTDNAESSDISLLIFEIKIIVKRNSGLLKKPFCKGSWWKLMNDVIESIFKKESPYPQLCHLFPSEKLSTIKRSLLSLIWSSLCKAFSLFFFSFKLITNQVMKITNGWNTRSKWYTSSINSEMKLCKYKKKKDTTNFEYLYILL